MKIAQSLYYQIFLTTDEQKMLATECLQNILSIKAKAAHSRKICNTHRNIHLLILNNVQLDVVRGLQVRSTISVDKHGMECLQKENSKLKKKNFRIGNTCVVFVHMTVSTISMIDRNGSTLWRKKCICGTCVP